MVMDEQSDHRIPARLSQFELAAKLGIQNSRVGHLTVDKIQRLSFAKTSSDAGMS